MDPVNKIPGTDTAFDQAAIILFGAPYDGTSSYRPGSRVAPEAIRSEFYGIENYSPELDADLEDLKNVCDLGNVFIYDMDAAAAHKAVGVVAGQIIGSGKIPFMIGGEHSLSLPVFAELQKRYPDLRLLHFDAHADLRNDYLGERLSHASVVRRIWDLAGDGKIRQFGIRSGDRSEYKWAAEGHTFLFTDDFSRLGQELDHIKGHPVYLSVDLDVLDPSVFPGTGTPEPGGVSFSELAAAIRQAFRADIVGADIVELAPSLDPGGISTITACKVLREMLLLMAMKNTF